MSCCSSIDPMASVLSEAAGFQIRVKLDEGSSANLEIIENPEMTRGFNGSLIRKFRKQWNKVIFPELY